MTTAYDPSRIPITDYRTQGPHHISRGIIFAGTPHKWQNVSTVDVIKQELNDVIGTAKDIKLDEDATLPWEYDKECKLYSTDTDKNKFYMRFLEQRLGIARAGDGVLGVPTNEEKDKLFVGNAVDAGKHVPVSDKLMQAYAAKFVDLDLQFALMDAEKNFRTDLYKWMIGEGPNGEYGPCWWVPDKKSRDKKMNLHRGHPGLTKGAIAKLDGLSTRAKFFLDNLARKMPQTEEECYLWYKYIIVKQGKVDLDHVFDDQHNNDYRKMMYDGSAQYRDIVDRIESKRTSKKKYRDSYVDKAQAAASPETREDPPTNPRASDPNNNNNTLVQTVLGTNADDTETQEKLRQAVLLSENRRNLADTLQKENQSKNSEIKTYQQRQQELQQQVKTSQDAVTKKDQEIQKIKDSLMKGSDSDKKKGQEQIDKLNGEKTQLSDKLAKSETEKKGLIEEGRKRIGDLEKKVMDSTNHKVQAEAAKQQLEIKVAQLSQQLKESTDKAAFKDNYIKQQQQETVKALEAARHSKDLEVKQIKAKTIQLEADSRELRSLKSSNQSLADKNSQQTKDYTIATNALRKLKTDLKSRDDQINKLTTDGQRTRKQLVSQIDDLKSKVDNLTRMNSAISEGNDIAQNLINKYDQANRNGTQELSDAYEQINHLNATLVQTNADLEAKKSQIKHFEAIQNNMNTQLEDADNKIQQLVNESTHRGDQLNRLQALHDQHKSTYKFSEEDANNFANELRNQYMGYEAANRAQQEELARSLNQQFQFNQEQNWLKQQELAHHLHQQEMVIKGQADIINDKDLQLEVLNKTHHSRVADLQMNLSVALQKLKNGEEIPEHTGNQQEWQNVWSEAMGTTTDTMSQFNTLTQNIADRIANRVQENKIQGLQQNAQEAIKFLSDDEAAQVDADLKKYRQQMGETDDDEDDDDGPPWNPTREENDYYQAAVTVSQFFGKMIYNIQTDSRVFSTISKNEIQYGANLYKLIGDQVAEYGLGKEPLLDLNLKESGAEFAGFFNKLLQVYFDPEVTANMQNEEEKQERIQKRQTFINALEKMYQLHDSVINSQYNKAIEAEDMEEDVELQEHINYSKQLQKQKEEEQRLKSQASRKAMEEKIAAARKRQGIKG